MTDKKAEKNATQDDAQKKTPEKKTTLKEIGGPSGLEPTRYGDWERKGIVSDF
ncbi:MAG: hypothetical protein CMN55_08595 [Sneathiella sp.]|jgi:hypothetical protein|uniref:DUF1674 domain-containing protein n=1 Tax=Sneathiella sp. TaxID=1964365 RepID=UPI000C47D431|nr:succinate dehydrogenase assembly factor 4 [Sneathiella sp.]MAL79155.1 hypothetical protein [Sneathiella sp.]|tara:strand:- start:173 stop:331 length:159 start_codon:yes stop_codon:yes gene_type:complete